VTRARLVSGDAAMAVSGLSITARLLYPTPTLPYFAGEGASPVS
jgi:hypothetical protein